MSTALLRKRLSQIAPVIKAQSGHVEETVYGVVDKINDDGSPHFIRKWKGVIGNMRPTDEEPTVYVIEKLEPAILKYKKYKCLYGGRAGTKSIMVMDTVIGDVNANGSKVFVLRERMKSLKDTIYAGIVGRIDSLSMRGFTPVPSEREVRHKNRGKITFGGMQNIIDMKGSFEYKYFLMEEAARTSQQTIDTLGPTLRGVDGAELWYVWNPESANDPMSLEFIVPFQAQLDRDGYYEDDYHMIIKVGFEDNPWFMHDQSLREEYEKDVQKKDEGRMSESRFNHIWHGAFNDDIDNSVIKADWFDACIDAHKKLGFDANGGKIAGFDPSDVGNDAKGYAMRHGVVFKDVREIDAEDANRAFDIASRDAKSQSVDSFGWDCDGMGALLRDQAARNFNGTKVHTFMYKGSEGVHHPDAIFKPVGDYHIRDSKKNKDVFGNKKAQNIIAFAERVYKTWEAVTHGKYCDPAELVSFDSETIPHGFMQKLRSEACRMPLKPADTFKFYTKQEMRNGIKQPDGSKIVIPSPNLFDAVVLSFDNSANITHKRV
ncbi:MAG: phage terminase large subunit, partial [Glaciecola sp.]